MPIGRGERIEQVRDGLTEWLDGKVDIDYIEANGGLAAILDGGENLWLLGAQRYRATLLFRFTDPLNALQ
jgi:hypothetical protein